jgi:inner membrane protein
MLTKHRGFSHSLLFALLITPLLVCLISKVQWFKVTLKDPQIYWLIFLSIFTHPILDSMTIYGTQLFWPSAMQPIGLGSIFIIDPLYTLPFLFFLIWFLINKSQKVIITGLAISSIYLMWSAGAQYHVKKLIEDSPSQQILVQPTPFNTILWRVLVMRDDEYRVGYYSLFDKNKHIEFKAYENNLQLLDKIETSDDIERLKWFMKDFYSIKQENNKIVMTDLRMGLEPNSYAFSYNIAEIDENGIKTINAEKVKGAGRNLERLKQVWARIWNKDIEL